MQGNSPIYSPWYIKEIRFNRKLKPNTSLGAYGQPVASQAFQTGGGAFHSMEDSRGVREKTSDKKTVPIYYTRL